MGFIYKITNDINGKIYIGKTELPDPYKRWKEHTKDCTRRKFEKRPLYEAMNKYGIEHFHFEVIEETENAAERERYWINELRTYIGFSDCNGYNATLGGDGKSYLNLDENEVIEYHIEEASYIVGDTAKHFNVDILTIKKILKKHHVHWMNHNDINRLNLFLKHGSVNQIDINTKSIVNKFLNITDASKELGVSRESIRDACHNKRGNHYSHGYAWYFDKEMMDAIINRDYIN